MENDVEFKKKLEEIFSKNNKSVRFWSLIGLIIFLPVSVYYLVEEPFDFQDLILFSFSAFCVYWFIKSLRERDLFKNKAYQILCLSPQSIVSVKEDTTSTGGAASYNVKFATVDGRSFAIPTAKKVLQQEVIEYISKNFISKNL